MTAVFCPLSDAERRGWQRRAVQVLDRLLGLNLPPLTWTIGPTGTLVGRVLTDDLDTRRDRWQAWVTALAATAAPDQVRPGVTDLYASAPDHDDPRVEIVLLTTVFHLDPDPDGR